MAQQKEIKRIVVLGPESTGKSTLCQLLSEHYQTLWVKEYAREYLLTHGKEYTYDDLKIIADGQIALEESGMAEAAVQQKQMVFIDTDMYVMKVWCEFVFGQCHNSILNSIATREYDLYLLCNIDLPWVKDELREYPDLETRAVLYKHYKDIMINQSTPWVEISGGYEDRLRTAIAAVNKLMI